MKRYNVFNKYGYLWVTLGLFLFSLAGHWIFAWYAYVQEALEHSQPIQASDYWFQTLRDTFENWQSEFLQLIWQVAGLAYLLYIGSPQSKEEDERLEEKLDYIIEKIDPKNAEKILKDLEKKYPKQ